MKLAVLRTGLSKAHLYPGLLRTVNDYKRSGETYLPIHWNIYHALTHKHSMALDCVRCSQCEKRCPQHLPVMRYLAEFSSALDGRTGHD